MKMVFNEWYGEIPVSLNRMLKKYNVSPADFQTLESYFGDNWANIQDAIRDYSPKGYFNEFLFVEAMRYPDYL